MSGFKFKHIRAHFVCSAGILALSAGTALAQSAPISETTPADPTATNVEQVIVSASRISIAGYQAPTPVTVVGSEQIQRDSKSSIGDVIRELPAVGNSSSPTNGGGAGNIVSAITGVDTVNLRNLGITRTLVLFDGQRVVQSNITGGADLSTVPASLVQRIDVVTGGASAAWGSDAVAGVVNLIINKNFEGLKGNIQLGDSWKDDLRTYKGELSYGQGFDGDRGHFIVSGQYTDSPDTIFSRQRSFYKAQALVNNPAYNGGANGQPQFIHATNVGLSQATIGGLITASPAGTGGANVNAFKGIQFVGSAGTPTPFSFGNVSGPLSNGGDAEHYEGMLNNLTVAYHTATLFGYGSYKITPNIKASLQLNFGKSWSENNSVPAVKLGNQTIRADNAYLDPTIAARMTALGVPSFSFGSINTNNLTPADFNNLSLKKEAQTFGIPVAITQRQLMRGVFTLDGSLGDDWSWNAYYQHGNVRVHQHVLNNVINANYTNAVDAVRVTTGNVGSSGLAVGSIACRSSLTNPANGCQPLNVFGVGVASQAAINYVTTKNDFQTIVLNEDVAAGSMQGVLPWSLPAGPVAVSFGAEYRKEGGRTVADPGAVLVQYSVGNFNNFAGQYNVEEGFLEVAVPILKDSIVQSLNFDAAGRITSYSTSGLVETYKLGVQSQVNDDIRLRTTWSLDIRAPNLSELFNSGVSTLSSAVDPRDNVNKPIFTQASGNSTLQPEIATTVSGGVVLTPHWIDGLSISADWYSILIKQSIFTTSSTQVLALCNANAASPYCSQLVFQGPQLAGFPAGTLALSAIKTFPANSASQTVSGLDFQADYVMPLFNGILNWHLVGNYTDEQTQNAIGINFDYAGSLSNASSITGTPKFKTTLASTYTEGGWSGTVQGRFIGAGKLNNAWGPLQVDNNSVPAIAYLDLRGSYKWNDNLQFYAAVDNVINTPPPNIPSTQAQGQNAYYFSAIREDIYDAIGRQYRVGIRFNY
ncbi:MAG: TonB-dependent receptor [Rhizomicrobium sp.]